jgi:hypothetical protein
MMPERRHPLYRPTAVAKLADQTTQDQAEPPGFVSGSRNRLSPYRSSNGAAGRSGRGGQAAGQLVEVGLAPIALTYPTSSANSRSDTLPPVRHVREEVTYQPSESSARLDGVSRPRGWRRPGVGRVCATTRPTSMATRARRDGPGTIVTDVPGTVVCLLVDPADRDASLGGRQHDEQTGHGSSHDRHHPTTYTSKHLKPPL